MENNEIMETIENVVPETISEALPATSLTIEHKSYSNVKTTAVVAGITGIVGLVVGLVARPFVDKKKDEAKIKREFRKMDKEMNKAADTILEVDGKEIAEILPDDE